MNIRLICIGQKMPPWVDHGYQEFAKRINGDIRLKLLELPMAKRVKNQSVEQFKRREAESIVAALQPQEYPVVLDVLGKSISTEDLATKLNQWKMLGQDIAIIIGGPDGLASEVLALAREKLSLSKLTLPHPLVRVIVAEQVYRAWSLSKGHPYHK
ncbi:MAG: 23S rRNA (pseudouridine(1915)-N(3))-methyltransferase RlmH [Pseudomonadales bacterium]|nr:23S rRNA (pseudouridine(1915)-N(3))-methyltransferase RlmH [Pseudomonadales bacterium]